MLRVDPGPDLTSNRDRDLAPELWNFGQIALIGLPPQMFVFRAIEELDDHAGPVAESGDGTFYDCSGIQLLGNLGQGLPAVLVSHDGGPRDHPDLADLRDLANEGLCQAVGHVILSGIAG